MKKTTKEDVLAFLSTALDDPSVLAQIDVFRQGLNAGLDNAMKAALSGAADICEAVAKRPGHTTGALACAREIRSFRDEAAVAVQSESEEQKR